MATIDVHSHILPLALVDALREGDFGDVSAVTSADGAPAVRYANGLEIPATPVLYDAEERIKLLDRDGVDIAVVSIAPPLFFYELDAAATVSLAKVVNDATAEFVAGSGRLCGLATVAMNDPRAAVAELRRAHDELGLRGVQIGTSVGSLTLDAEELDPFWATAEELELPVFVHPYASLVGVAAVPGVGRFGLSNSVGNPAELHVAAARLITGGVFDRHPGLVVQLSHGGGGLPYQVGRLDQAHRAAPDARSVALRPPSEYLDHFLFDTIVFDERALRFLVERMGPERVIYGTDSPFAMADTGGLAVRDMLGATAARQILEENARRVFRL